MDSSAPQDVGKDGYVPSRKPAHYITGEATTAENLGFTDRQKIRFIQRFIDICNKENIRLIFTISPAYTKIAMTHYKQLNDIANQNSIELLDFHSKKLFLDHPEYFEDRVHLWDKGARIYSKVFAGQLKSILYKNHYQTHNKKMGKYRNN